MVESVSSFPFHKLLHSKHIMLEVMMYVEYPEVLKIMFTLGKETRTFLQRHYITIRNGFVNDGLVTYHFEDFQGFHKFVYLEKLYFEALSRNVDNRKITLAIFIYENEANIINEI